MIAHGPIAKMHIDIDEELLSQTMAAAGSPTKRATVEEGLRLLVCMREQAKALAELRGLGWEGDLDAMRQGRTPRRLSSLSKALMTAISRQWWNISVSWSREPTVQAQVTLRYCTLRLGFVGAVNSG